MLVVDLLHEFELGVFKSLFTHLIRILYAASERPGALVDALNTRCEEPDGKKLMLTPSQQIPSGSYFRPLHYPAVS